MLLQEAGLRKTLLYETLNKRNISEVEVQENYVKFNYELEGINQLTNLSQFLLKISFFEEDSNDLFINFKKLYCRESETIYRKAVKILPLQKIKKNSAVEDMCKAFDESFFEEGNAIPNLLRNTQIFIVPKNDMTINLANMVSGIINTMVGINVSHMNKTFEEVAERVNQTFQIQKIF
ncbi:hypothetical protein Anas_12869 [Armadillidium nasatum]|uniref:Uncharacterized protein n=1 Tax=Armadillidium nasatum TaxID=96803 RepID=A0A5N5T620_9CRUS|nr:hypothetical protein Anas_12869 [Armadillidium nasatum]